MTRSPSALLARSKLAQPRRDICLPQDFAIAAIVTGGCGVDNSGMGKNPWNDGTLRKNRQPVALMTQLSIATQQPEFAVYQHLGTYAEKPVSQSERRRTRWYSGVLVGDVYGNQAIRNWTSMRESERQIMRQGALNVS